MLFLFLFFSLSLPPVIKYLLQYRHVSLHRIEPHKTGHQLGLRLWRSGNFSFAFSCIASKQIPLCLLCMWVFECVCGHTLRLTHAILACPAYIYILISLCMCVCVSAVACLLNISTSCLLLIISEIMKKLQKTDRLCMCVCLCMTEMRKVPGVCRYVIFAKSHLILGGDFFFLSKHHFWGDVLSYGHDCTSSAMASGIENRMWRRRQKSSSMLS